MAKVANFARAGKAAEAIAAMPIALSLLFLEMFSTGMFEVRVKIANQGLIVRQ